GTASIVMVTSDLGNSGSGGVKTAQDTIDIAVQTVADDPIAQDDDDTLSEDTATTIPVLSNDSDPDNLSGPANAGLTGVKIEGQHPMVGKPITLASGATVTLNASGTITYTPAANQNGSDSFTYQVSDSSGATSNTATVSITITAVNDAPVPQ